MISVNIFVCIDHKSISRTFPSEICNRKCRSITPATYPSPIFHADSESSDCEFFSLCLPHHFGHVTRSVDCCSCHNEAQICGNRRSPGLCLMPRHWTPLCGHLKQRGPRPTSCRAAVPQSVSVCTAPHHSYVHVML